MPYVGNSPASNFASVTKDTFSGDGSTTAFTLSKAATTNGVAVFVENVRQEPTTAYAVSGTTLTFTAAPVSASGNNIYVLHHNAPASTATHPAGQDLTAANATLTGDVTIGSGTAADRKIVFDGNAQDYHVGLDDSADKLIIGKGSALGTTSHIVTDADGNITMPLQPMYRAVLANRMSLSGTAETQVTDITENFDVGNDATGGTFTCPIDGKYLATFSGSYRSDGASYVDASIKQNTSYVARGYSELPNAAQVRGANAWHPFGFSALISCSQDDTIKFFFGAGTGASQLLESPYTVMQVKLVG